MSRSLDRVNERFEALNCEALALVEEAEALVTEQLNGGVQFTFTISAPRDVLTDFERAQSLCFVTKFDSLPENYTVTVKQFKGKFYPDNIDEFRHLLNEYRPIVQNQKDSTHYSKIHRFCRQKLLNNDPGMDLSIKASDEMGRDITESFVKLLDQKRRAISWLISQCDYDYIYNGILQHSDHRHTTRYIDEYTSGELHYVFFKHVVVCTYIKRELWWHYKLLKVFSGVTMGPL